MRKKKTHINQHIFNQIYNLYYDSLCKYLSFYTKDIETIEDLIQEIFLSIWENREKREVEHPKTYLFRVARNKIFNYLRDQQKHSQLREAWYLEQLESGLPDNEKFDMEQLLADIEKAIHMLPQKCREIFLLSKIHNYTYQQIADHKQISRHRLHRFIALAGLDNKDMVSL